MSLFVTLFFIYNETISSAVWLQQLDVRRELSNSK